MYGPAKSANPAAIVRELFSTTLGIPICDAMTTNLEGTGGFFFTDTAKPGTLYLLTSRHVLFHPDKEENKLYMFQEGSGETRRQVMLMGEAAFNARCKAIESAIHGKHIIIDWLNSRLEAADRLEDQDDADAERKDVKRKMQETLEVIVSFTKLLADITRDWKDEKNRVIGHVTLSPPISDNFGGDGFTDDWAVIQIHPSMISRLNFSGNAIDLGFVEGNKVIAWMNSDPANTSPFQYPYDRLLRFSGTVSDQEMFPPNFRIKDHDNDPVIKVLKNGNASGLTMGRLNTIRAFVREYYKGKPGKMSKEVAVLPHNSESGPFSEPGDSGSVVINSSGRVCGILSGGDGTSDIHNCAFVTSINFLIKRLADFGIKANIFPLPTDI